MKRLLLGTTAAVAMVASASAADMYTPGPQEQYMMRQLLLTGVFDLYGGARWIKGDDYTVNNTHGMLGGNAYVNIPISDMFSAQLDLQVEKYFDTSDEYNPLGSAMTGGHLSYRDPDLFLLGVFGGAAMPSMQGQPSPSRIGWIGGVEGQLYLNDFTLYGQGGYGDIRVDDDPEGFVKGWFVRGVGRYFFMDDYMLQGDVSYGETKKFIDGDDKGKFWNWSVKAVGRLMDTMPLYGTLEYRGGHYDSTTEGDKGGDHAVLVGLSIRLGTATLKENDRYGATLDLPMLPVRAASWVEALD